MATITEIQVTYQTTENLGNYSNVKPSVSLTARMDEGDDPEVEREKLMATARAMVQTEVDNALEASDLSPKYSTDPLFDVLVKSSEKHGRFIAIVPTGIKIGGAGRSARRRRLAAAETYAQQYGGDFETSAYTVFGPDDLEEAKVAIGAVEAAEDEDRRLRQEKWDREAKEREAAYEERRQAIQKVEAGDDEDDDEDDEK